MKVTTMMAFILDDAWWEQFRESLGEGIGYWASAYQWDTGGLTVENREGGTSAATFQELADAASRLGKRYRTVYDALLDPGDLDPDIVDMVVQQACLLDIVYG